jgi:hypothetical protein
MLVLMLLDYKPRPPNQVMGSTILLVEKRSGLPTVLGQIGLLLLREQEDPAWEVLLSF